MGRRWELADYQRSNDHRRFYDGVTRVERLLRLRSSVTPEGDTASLAFQFTSQGRLVIEVPFVDMGPILNEVRTASTVMVARQRLKLDRGLDKIMEICEHAIRPIDQRVLIDPATGDRLFVLQFADHLPMCIRMSPDEVTLCREKSNKAIAKAAH